MEVRGQRSEVRGQRSEVRGQKSEVRSQRSEVRGQKSEVRSQSLPAVSLAGSEANSSKSPLTRGVAAERPAATGASTAGRLIANLGI